MKAGRTMRLACPHCGRYKCMESIMGGNTFCGTAWSDSKKEYPMLPSISPIQRCPKCGAYFFYEEGMLGELMDENEFKKTLEGINLSQTEIEKQYDKALSKWFKEADNNGFGHLNEQESREAYESLYSESLSKHKKTDLLLTRLYAFNDEYLRNGNTMLPDLQTVQEDFIYKIIELFPNDIVLIAELYREMGQFEKAIELLRGAIASDLDEKGVEVAKKVLEHAENQDRSVFVVAKW